MAKYDMTYSWRYRVNNPVGVRERIGALLRAIASRIDGCWSLSIKIASAPEISRSVEVECIRFAFGRLGFALEDSVRAEACETLMKENPGVTWGVGDDHQHP